MKKMPLAIIPNPKKIRPLEYHERMMLRYSSFLGIKKKIKKELINI